MTPAQLAAWVSVVQILISAGAATVAQIRAWFGGGTVMTNDELNAILDSVLQDAITREAQAKKAAGL